MKMTSSYIELSNKDKFIDIPNEEFIPGTILKDVLQNAGLSFSEFEEHLQSIEQFKSMIDLGIVARPKRD